MLRWLARDLAQHGYVVLLVHYFDRLHDDPSTNQRGSGWRAIVAELVQQSQATLNKCFQFRRCYEEEELSELEQLGVG